MKFDRFEDIIAWKKSRIFVKNIYKQFRELKDFSYKDQVYRAAVSIMNNIAEGFEKRTNTDFKKFLYIAKASCAEVRSMLYLGFFLELGRQSVEISKILSGLIKTL